MRTIEMTSGDAVLRGSITGGAPTVLLLHAGGERRTVWDPITATLKRGGVCSVSYDLRGHGDSSGYPASLAQLAADVRAMVRQERAPVTLVGASIGGVAAIDALADPATAEAIVGLVLVDVVPDLQPARLYAWLAERGRGPLFPELVDDVFARAPALRETFAAIDRPVVLVRAGTESPVTDADVDRVRAANGATLVVDVPKAGHLIAQQAPDRLAEIILEHALAWHDQ